MLVLSKMRMYDLLNMIYHAVIFAVDTFDMPSESGEMNPHSVEGAYMSR